MFKEICGICIVINIVLGKTVNDNQYELLKSVKQGFNEYHETKVRPPYLNQALKKLPHPYFFRDQDTLRFGNTGLDKAPKLDSGVTCDLCYAVANFIVGERRGGLDRNMLKGELTQICDLIKIESDRVCDAFLELNIDILVYLIDSNNDLNPARICDIVLQQVNCNATSVEWSVDIPEGQSPKRDQPHSTQNPIKIFHITDIHYDPLYTPNKVNRCGEPVCCQNDQADGSTDDGTACGYWTEYLNDVPEHLIDETIRQANTLDIDYVYFTGDIISHRVWSTSEEDNANNIKKLLKKFKDGFKVPVYPVLGNHEPSPLNSYEFENSAPSNFSTKWLYDLIDQEWSTWLPDEARETISKGGFYTVSPRDGFRLIVLNPNIAYTLNMWLFESEVDPYGQLDWLVKILKQAEDKNESVHILSHIPSGGYEILKVWSREYNKIVNRFANTITGQFNGHIHRDQFVVYFNNSEPYQGINVAWNGASLTPFDNANPSFKIYHIDDSYFNVVDVDQWTFNLTLANQNADKSPEWYKQYSFKNAFGLDSLEPSVAGNLLQKMAANHSLLADYHIYSYKNSDPAVKAGCDENCQKKYLCEIATSQTGQLSQCEFLQNLYDQNL